jgi:hypothetical protein
MVFLFELNGYAVMKNIDGVSHEESLIRPHPGGNCLNWVLGHIVATRNAILRQLGQDPIWSEEEARPYVRGSSGLSKGEGARPLSDIVASFRESQERILSGLARIGPDQLAASLASKDGGNLAGLQFHEAYHAGQLGLLRRLSGRQGAIA